MTMTIGSPLSFAFLLLSAAWVAGFFTWAIGRCSDPRKVAAHRAVFLLAFGLWSAILLALGATGVLAVYDSVPPRPIPFFFGTVVLVVILAAGRLGRVLAAKLSIASLVLFHAFRVPIELMLWSLERDGLVNSAMTFEGRNFDIVTGIAALVLGLIAWRRSIPLWILWLFNAVGLALLVHIVVVAVLSMPTPFRVFSAGAPNVIVGTAPYILLPGVFVGAALFCHIVLTRRLIAETKTRSAPTG